MISELNGADLTISRTWSVRYGGREHYRAIKNPRSKRCLDGVRNTLMYVRDADGRQVCTGLSLPTRQGSESDAIVYDIALDLKAKPPSFTSAYLSAYSRWRVARVMAA